ncbi:hypothetical protein ACJVDH_04555 [Pedobacter sp. AW1-32]|uniref:hypothetical protein n=1 Tax=Pedobacter sp. AW1-32 TaxID=3383026 RepID=UPI003FEE6B80
MKNKSQLLRKLLLTIFIGATLLSSCKKDNAQSLTADPAAHAIAKGGKEAFGMIVKDSSILLSNQSLALLSKIESNELLFSSKPAQADSMREKFIVTSGVIADKAPEGLLLTSLGTYEDGKGFHVKVKKAELSDYIIYANISGTIAFKPKSETDVIQSGGETLSAPKLMATTGNTITGFDIIVNQNFPFVGVGNTGGYLGLDLVATPSFTYNIVAASGRFEMSLAGNLDIKKLKTSLYASVGPPTFTFGDVPIPFAVIPIGPILITPYISIGPYLEGTIKAETIVSVTSRGNINLSTYKTGLTDFGGTADITYEVDPPVVERLGLPITVEAGLQATIGIGAYGKLVYTQLQGRVGPKATVTPNFLTNAVDYNYDVTAKVVASAGASVIGFQFFQYQKTLYEQTFYSDSGSVPFTSLGL